MKQLLIFLIFPILGYCSTPEEIIQYVNSQNTHWTAGFPAKSRESMMKSVISDKDIVGFRENIPISNKFSSKFDLAPSFDAREQWPECSSIPLINDVSECKSNWAFAASEAMSDRLCINSGGMIDTVLSAQELLTCCVGTFSCGEGCSGGGNPFKAWQYWQKHGLPTGGSYVSNFGCKPYTIAPCGQTINNVTYPACTNTTVATPVCEKTCRDGYGVDLDKDRHFGASVDQLPNSQIEIQSDVMLNGPIEVTFEVFDDFFQYQTGIYVHLTGNKQGHLSVRVLGWGIWQGVPYWLLANSWGYSWGENGTFRVLRGLNECGIEANAISGMPKLG